MAVSDLWGIGFPFSRGEVDFPDTSEGDDVIRDSLLVLLLTGRGERRMRPTFGVNIHSFVFEDLSPIVQARISQDVRRTIEENEPRVEVLAVNVEKDEDNGTFFVTLVYRIADEIDDMTIPLGEGGGE